nr:zinc-binding dehydrogenase [uncultured Christensenella sp.]
MLTEVLQIKPGQKLLIHAGSGGIGSFAIQLAKALGAFVATTTSTPNVEWVKALGADIVIDYRQQKFEEELRDYNAVFDTLGGQSLIDSFQVVQKGGKIGSLIGLSGDGAEQRLKELQSETGVSYQYYYMRPDGKQLSRITQYIEQGQIKPVIDRIFPFEEAQQAIEYSESGHAKGKIILKIK